MLPVGPCSAHQRVTAGCDFVPKVLCSTHGATHCGTLEAGGHASQGRLFL